MKKSWLLVCLFNFLIAAFMGLLLRAAYIYPVNINFRFFVHAHSHIAMLGWAYLMIFSLIVKQFVPTDKVRKYNSLFWFTQITVIGMMVSFPLQGYALFSIAFSTLHIFCSYYFFYLVNRHVPKSDSAPCYMLKAALLFMVISTLGAWSLGATGASGGKNTPLYYASLQTFLHFQFNGWLIFAVLALFFKHLEKRNISIDTRKFRLFYIFLIIAVITTLGLPLSWYYEHWALSWLNAVGILTQMAALALLVRLLRPTSHLIKTSGLFIRLLFLLPLLSLLIKLAVQAITILPQAANASYTIRDLTIGFIHLAMLGIITGFLFFFIRIASQLFKIGILLFYIGYILTEILLFAQGLTAFFESSPLPHYYHLLALVSMLLPAGLLLIFTSFIHSQSRHS